MTDVPRLLENPVEATDIVTKFVLLLVKHVLTVMKKKIKKNMEKESIGKRLSNREKSPTSGCVCAHPREPPTGNVISCQNTLKRAGTPATSGWA